MYQKIIYRCGRVVEVIKFYSHRYHPKGIKGPPQQKSPEQIKKANRIQQEKKLNRIINANFTQNDVYCTLTWENGDHKPQNEEEMKKAIRRFFTNLKGMYKRRGYELKYVYACSMGRRGNRPHFHIIVNAPMGYTEAVDLIKKQWIRKDITMEDTMLALNDEKKRPVYDTEGEYPALMNGWVKPEPLYKEGDYRSLANYIIKQGYEGEDPKDEEPAGEAQVIPIEEHKKNRKAFEHSRNLIIPQPERTIVKAEHFSERVKAPKGYYIEPGSVKKGSDWSGWPYLTYTLIAINPPKKRGRPPGKKGKALKCG